MFSGDKSCRRKMLFICAFLAFSLSVLFSVFSSCSVSAVAVPIHNFSVSALPPNGSSYTLVNDVYYNSLVTINGAPPYAVKLYRFDSDNITVTGNIANLSFETNLVFSQSVSQSAWVANFVNKDYISVLRCSMDTTPLTIQSSRVSYRTTDWTGPAPSTIGYNGKNKTLTVYGNVVLAGLTSGSHVISCTVGSDDFAFYQQFGGSAMPNFYIEQQPTSVVFTTSESDALSKQQIQSIDHVSSSIDSLNDGVQQRYDDEIERENAKEEELENQSEGLSLNASITANPFTGLFFQNPFNTGSICYSTQRLHLLFNVSDPWNICSPYPSALRGIFSIISSLFISGLLIRLYYKKLKGGVDG